MHMAGKQHLGFNVNDATCRCGPSLSPGSTSLPVHRLFWGSAAQQLVGQPESCCESSTHQKLRSTSHSREKHSALTGACHRNASPWSQIQWVVSIRKGYQEGMCGNSAGERQKGHCQHSAQLSCPEAWLCGMSAAALLLAACSWPSHITQRQWTVPHQVADRDKDAFSAAQRPGCALCLLRHSCLLPAAGLHTTPMDGASPGSRQR